MKTFEFPYYGEMVKGYLVLGRYREPAHPSVKLIGWNREGYWENFASLSINTDYDMEPGEFIANHDCTELVANLAKLGLFEPTGKTLSYGYVKKQPVYRITDKAREFAQDD